MDLTGPNLVQFFLYISKPGSKRPEVKAFVRFYLAQASELVKEVGYISLPDKSYQLASDQFEKWLKGSLISGNSSDMEIKKVALK